MRGSAGLCIEDLEKRYPDGTLIGPLEFSVSPGEFFSLLGPSGCGKTTTLKCIAGIETPSRGSIRLGSRDLVSMPANRRPLGIVFQNLALFPHLSVAANIAFGLKLRKLPGEAISRKVHAIAEQVEVEALLDKMPSEISGGQQQRVAIARCLVLEPELLLLDEPLSALDAKLRQALRVQLKELQKRTGVTFIYVTHDQSEALSMSDRIAVFHRGTIAQVGRPEEIYARPGSAFVADFIGEGNLLVADASDAGMLRSAGGGRIRVTGSPAGKASASSGGIFVRPEFLVAAICEGDADAGDLDFSVAQLLYEGASTRVIANDVGGRSVSILHAHGSGAMTLAVGTRVRLQVDAQHLIRFPPQ